jgi:hypothetical protein
MKNQVLAIALAGAFALPALANNEIDPGFVTNFTTEIGKSRDEVRAELVSAQHAGEITVNAELGTVAATHAEPMQLSDKSRAEVVAEVAKARRSGDYVANAELGTKASQL